MPKYKNGIQYVIQATATPHLILIDTYENFEQNSCSRTDFTARHTLLAISR